ncbi:MAG: PQQ-like beta-propeller repeat protein, partial [Planctomycetota bacterium]|nr:PQQ-like beta-propeller repeat protein [Planctomycetota bacterium]
LLEDAVRLFRQAQEANEGAFFARAHNYEGRARELLAQAQADDAAARQVREATVAQFRQDAADAAPAFYDLGIALASNDHYAEAIDAYRSYLQWIDERSKTLLWHLFSCSAESAKAARSNAFLLTNDRILYLTNSALCCAETNEGKVIWRFPLSVPEIAHACYATQNGKVIFYEGQGRFHYLDLATGQREGTFQFPESLPAPGAPYEPNRLFLTADGQIAVFFRFALSKTINDKTEFIPNILAGLEARQGKLLWSITDFTIGRTRGSIRQEGDMLLLIGNRAQLGIAPPLQIFAIDMRTGNSTAVLEQAGIVCDTFLFQEPAPMPDGKLIIGQEPGIKSNSYAYDPTAQRIECSDALPRKRFCISPPKRWWLIRDEPDLRSDDERQIDLREITTNRLLWTYVPSGRLGHFVDSSGRLIAHVGNKIVCVSPPEESKGVKRQHLAWARMGEALSRLGQKAEAEKAFMRAEQICCYDPDVLWTWACALPQEPSAAKERFRLLDMFLFYAPLPDERRPVALARLGEIAGLRFIFDGNPQWDGERFPQNGPFVVHTAGFRPSQVPAGSLAAYDEKTGELLWSRFYRHRRLASSSLLLELYPSFRHCGDYFLCYFDPKIFPHGNPWENNGPLFVRGDARTGQLAAAPPAEKLPAGGTAEIPLLGQILPAGDSFPKGQKGAVSRSPDALQNQSWLPETFALGGATYMLGIARDFSSLPALLLAKKNGDEIVFAGGLRFLRPPFRGLAASAYYRPDLDAVVFIEAATKSTYVFDRKKLIDFLLLPGE